jgi:hypothetical protein
MKGFHLLDYTQFLIPKPWMFPRLVKINELNIITILIMVLVSGYLHHADLQNDRISVVAESQYG